MSKSFEGVSKDGGARSVADKICLAKLSLAIINFIATSRTMREALGLLDAERKMFKAYQELYTTFVNSGRTEKDFLQL